MALGAIVLIAWKIESRLGPDVLTVTPKGNSSVLEVRRFGRFGLYSAGISFRGLKLNAVEHAVVRTAKAETTHFSFLYGSCDIPLSKGKAGGGCGPPLGVQNWPACKVSIGGMGPYGHLDEWITIRGVPATFHDRYGQLKIATGKTTIFLFGQGREFLLAAARSLRGVNNSVGMTDNLPKPAPGALDGTLEC
jgi:hypothetical protein